MASTTTKKAFVTGGSGYVGRNILRTLIQTGFEVRALARSEASANVVQKLGAEPVMGDLSNTQVLLEGMTGAHYLIHAAADTGHGSMETSQQEKSNLDGTRNVYEQAAIAGARRAIHLSSEAVLLTGHPLVNADETHPTPENAAGDDSRTKAQAEQYHSSLTRRDPASYRGLQEDII